jgi:hypothetical protein
MSYRFKMGSNIIGQRLEIIEELLLSVDKLSKEETLVLIGMREALIPYRYICRIIESEGGNL